MCVVSNVYDDFNKRFPKHPLEFEQEKEPYPWTTEPVKDNPWIYKKPKIEEDLNIEEMRKWITEPVKDNPWIYKKPKIEEDLNIEEMRKFMADFKKYAEEFREAKQLAERLDILMKQPDCVDPDKAKLEKRIADLERRLDEVAKVLPAAK